MPGACLLFGTGVGGGWYRGVGDWRRRRAQVAVAKYAITLTSTLLLSSLCLSLLVFDHTGFFTDVLNVAQTPTPSAHDRQKPGGGAVRA